MGGTPGPGWYELSDSGKWSGFDCENCRAVSAAVFGDPEKIEYQSVTSAVRFTAMANGESDMLSRTTTWTLFRDTQLGLDFTTVSFYDGQGFMVTRSEEHTSELQSLMRISYAVFCLKKKNEDTKIRSPIAKHDKCTTNIQQSSKS